MPFPSTIEMSTFIRIRFKRLRRIHSQVLLLQGEEAKPMSARGKVHLMLFCMRVSANCVVNINLPACGSATFLIAFMRVRGGAGICKYSSVQTEPQLSEGAMVIIPEPLSVAFEGKKNREKLLV